MTTFFATANPYKYTRSLLLSLCLGALTLLAACTDHDHDSATQTTPAKNTTPNATTTPIADTDTVADYSTVAAGEKVGGETTVWATGSNAFSFPSANLADEERTKFFIGNSFFKRNWVQSPASTKARDGLGPHFIARSCGGCHSLDGRGAPPDFSKGLAVDYAKLKPEDIPAILPEDYPQPVGLLLRLSIPGEGAHGEPVPDPVYGDQFNNAGIRGVKAEGKVAMTFTTITGQFADGTPYTLRKPHYHFTELGYGALHKDAMHSPRIAPQVIGMGLIDAIPASEIEANVRHQATLGAPLNKAIKGKANYVWDVYAQKKMIGRYGWKANVATVAHQSAGAFNGDIGITSTHFPNQTCTAAQTDCLNAPSGEKTLEDGSIEHEIPDDLMDKVIFYQNTLAPPARRNIDQPAVIQGEKIFQQAQCAQCHRPSYTTTAPPFPRLTSAALNGQTIFPYTDLLLHDMGDDLADGRPDFLANGKQWKTPPLWGIGLIPDVNKHQFLMHDGRANGVMEAILWHGGEAQASKDYVLKLKKADRDALVAFVNSL